MSFKQWFTQEYDKDLEVRVKNALQISMTDSERAQSRDFLTRYMRMHPAHVRIQKSKSWFSLRLHPYPIIATVLIIVLGGSTAGAATLAQSALPGDLLYPIKVNLNEQVREVLATTPEKRASVALSRAEERIKELEKLEARGADETLILSSEERIDEQVRDAEEKSLETRDKNGERGEREQRLVAVLRAHEQIINKNQEPVGGSLVPDVSLEEVVAFTTHIAADSTTTSAPQTSVMAAEVAREEVETKKAARIAPTSSSDTENMTLETKSSSTPSKTLARQKKAAEQRVDALQKLIKKLERQADSSALQNAQIALESAQELLENGDKVISDNETEASFLLTKALTTAIDAREALNKKEKTDDSRDRSGRYNSRDGKNRDRDD